jgi:4-alpha-glucanotransferase
LRRQNPSDERINVPANPTHYWQYRMHMTLENLLEQDRFNTELHTSIVASGRA